MHPATIRGLNSVSAAVGSNRVTLRTYAFTLDVPVRRESPPARAGLQAGLRKRHSLRNRAHGGDVRFSARGCAPQPPRPRLPDHRRFSPRSPFTSRQGSKE